ncbi:MAG: hypothetical protein LBC96_05075 [Lachnospiraceae bacterium]|jgi:hypothetical protein|nr:hypothetical protein [Lachnospiraceae bacterium]
MNTLLNKTVKLKKLFNTTTLAIAASVFFLVSLIPIVMAGMVNRASGDDLGYGGYTHRAWLETGSLFAVMKVANEQVLSSYTSWQGTWSSIFLFTLQPEVFNDKAYVGVTAVTLLLWMAVTSFVLYFILVKKLRFPINNYVLINVLFLVVNIHFVESYRSSLFWFNGIIHYQLPYLLCVWMLYLLIQAQEKHQMRYLLGICMVAMYMGGSNYQAALLLLFMMVTAMLFFFFLTREKKSFWLVLPVALEVIGLVVSMKAPGNQVRGGEEFGHSLSRMGETVLMSFYLAVRDIGAYLLEKPIMIVLLVIMLSIVFYSFLKMNPESDFRYPLPGLFVAISFCSFVMMQTPQLYAGASLNARSHAVMMARGLEVVYDNAVVGTSGGVWNFNLQVFTLMVLISWIYVNGWLFAKYGERIRSIRKTTWNKYVVIICLPFLITTVLVATSTKYGLGLTHTTFWISYDYLRSGRAKEYKWQMDLQTAILRDENQRNAVVPFTNDWQGPLMNMTITEDPTAFTNSVTSLFYGKDSVVAIDRDEWNELYGHMWPEYRKE